MSWTLVPESSSASSTASLIQSRMLPSSRSAANLEMPPPRTNTLRFLSRISISSLPSFLSSCADRGRKIESVSRAGSAVSGQRRLSISKTSSQNRWSNSAGCLLCKQGGLPGAARSGEGFLEAGVVLHEQQPHLLSRRVDGLLVVRICRLRLGTGLRLDRRFQLELALSQVVFHRGLCRREGGVIRLALRGHLTDQVQDLRCLAYQGVKALLHGKCARLHRGDDATRLLVQGPVRRERVGYRFAHREVSAGTGVAATTGAAPRERDRNQDRQGEQYCLSHAWIMQWDDARAL